MLTDRSYVNSIEEFLTQNLNVIDALQESETSNWKEIILLGFTYDQSDLLKFETICHSSGRYVMAHPAGEYTLETLPDSTYIQFLATEDGNCRVTHAKVAVTYSPASSPKILGVTLFMFARELQRSELSADKNTMADLLETLYWRHKQDPIAVYAIGPARAQNFNIPELFQIMDDALPRPLSRTLMPSTALINQRLIESKEASPVASEDKYDTRVEAEPVIDESAAIAAPVKTARPSRPHFRFYADSRPHRFPRNPVVRESRRQKQVEEQNKDESKNSFCLTQ